MGQGPTSMREVSFQPACYPKKTCFFQQHKIKVHDADGMLGRLTISAIIIIDLKAKSRFSKENLKSRHRAALSYGKGRDKFKSVSFRRIFKTRRPMSWTRDFSFKDSAGLFYFYLIFRPKYLGLTL